MLRALLTNISILAKNTTTKKTVRKEPHFDKKWGTQSALDKNVDKSTYAVDQQDHTAQINEQILVMFKTTPNKSNSTRNVFLNKIAGDSREFIEQQRARLLRAKAEEQLCHNSMAVMTEHIFELLKSYSYELNNALGYGPFHVAATNPQAVSEVVKYDRLRQPEETISYYRARLSTTSFSLVLRGDKKGIQFFVIPVARAIGLSNQERQFTPVLRLSTRVVEDSVSWETENGRALTPSMVEVICMNLFQRLIDETKIQLSNADEDTTEDAAQEVSA